MGRNRIREDDDKEGKDTSDPLALTRKHQQVVGWVTDGIGD